MAHQTILLHLCNLTALYIIIFSFNIANSISVFLDNSFNLSKFCVFKFLSYIITLNFPPNFSSSEFNLKTKYNFVYSTSSIAQTNSDLQQYFVPWHMSIVCIIHTFSISIPDTCLIFLNSLMFMNIIVSYAFCADNR